MRGALQAMKPKSQRTYQCGLIFGYDLGISGGVTSMDPVSASLQRFFPSVYRKEKLDTSTNQYCKFDDMKLTLFTSSLYLAALVASFFPSWVTRELGRRISMLLGGLIFLVGAAINAFSINIAMLIFGRLLLGVGVGFSIQAPVLFKTIGFGADASLGSSLITGAVNLLATFVSVYGIDKWGRRFLFLEGGIQLFVFQVLLGALIGWKFGITGVVTDLSKWYAILVVILIYTYVAGYGGLGGHWDVAQLFLTMLCHLKFGLFFFFAFFVAVMSVFIYFFLPETKNIPIEEMSTVWREHWFWKRFNNPEDQSQV
ncbi:hypothetical protein Dsin_020277 [Dipteronia sinensis]|uniref:Major facilitator superfamily (MFS) profile domain-containing protein n=1 Tax=Dipteronia sinensis TaxID=43782 RepID=A0AAE0E3U9_9ROSI|nr:hypothetical protein Dsin_020277 [Dipteronia sinensis]